MVAGGGAAGMVSSILTTVQALSTQRAQMMQADWTDGALQLGQFDRPNITDERLEWDEVKEYLRHRDITFFSLEDLEKEYGKEAAKIAADMLVSFEKFQTDYFPTAYFDAASEWITNALTEGGAGANKDVEDQQWTKVRSEALAAAEQEAMTTTAGWAARGFVIPPGALVHQVAEIERVAQKKIGAASRLAAVESLDSEVANVRAALGHAVTLRTAALDAAREHMIALARAITQGSELAEHTHATLSKLNETLYAYHSNLRETRDWNYSNQKYEMERNKTRILQEGEWKQRSFDALMKAIQASIESAGAQAAAGLNGLHGSAAISGSDITNISVLG